MQRDSGRGEESSSRNRRGFLKAFGTVATATTAGCTVTVADYKFTAKKQSNGTDTPTPTPTRTSTPEGTTPIDYLPSDDTYPLVEPINETQTDTVETVTYEFSEFQLVVENAKDAIGDGPNNLELFGVVEIFTNAQIVSGYQGRVWGKGKQEPVTVKEDNVHFLSPQVEPVRMTFRQSPDLDEKHILVLTKIWDADKGANNNDFIGRAKKKIFLSSPAGWYDALLTSSDSRVKFRVKIEQV